MSNADSNQYHGREAWEILAEVLCHHGDGAKLSRFIQGAFSEQYVRAWRRHPESEDYRDTGRISPLERVKNIIDFVTLRDGSPRAAQPIAHYTASLCNGVFFPSPPMASTTDSESLQHISNVLKETGEAVEEFRRDWFELTPGKITKKEYQAIAREADEAIASLISMRTWVAGKVRE